MIIITITVRIRKRYVHYSKIISAGRGGKGGNLKEVCKVGRYPPSIYIMKHNMILYNRYIS